MKKPIKELVPEDERFTGYLVDLEGFAFEDGSHLKWIQAFPVGEYKHPLYGKISMTHERALRMAANANSKVIGTDISIDFAHRKDVSKGQQAAAWVKQAEGRPDGLWLQVEFTDDAAKEIEEKKWRYFSPEFVDSFTNRETGVKTKDVLLGGGLTNRPFLRNILPVNLDEFLGDSSSVKEKDEHRKGGERMEKFLEALRIALKLDDDADEEAVAKALKLDDDADEDAVMEAIALALTPKPPEKKKEKEKEPEPDPTKQLDLSDPAVKALVDRVEATEKRLAASEIALKLTDIDGKLEKWNRGDKVAIPVALNEEIKSIMLNAPSDVVNKLESVLDTIVDKGLVELEERGKLRPRGGSNDSVIDEVEKGIKKLMEADEDLDYADASSIYFRDHEGVYERYLEEVATVDGGEG